MMQQVPVQASYQSRPLPEDRIIRVPAVYKGEVVERVVDIGGGLLVEQDVLITPDMEPSVFENVETAPPDAILTLATWFKEDKFPKKVNLGIGAYRTEQGKPWPLPSVLAAQMAVVQDPN